MDDKLVIAGKEFDSRLMIGTGRHRTNEEMVESVRASGAEIITVAIRRLDLDNLEEKNILGLLRLGRVHDSSKYRRMQDGRGSGIHRATGPRGYRHGLDQARSDSLCRVPAARSQGHLRRREAACRRRFRCAALYSRRSRSCQGSGRPGLRDGYAAWLGYRFGARASRPLTR